MFGWLTRKLKSGRIKMSLAQLGYELEALSPSEIALVLVTATEFSKSLASESGQMVFIAKAIENPSSLNPEDAYTLYSNLEDILISGQVENQSSYARVRERMGEEFATEFKNKIKLSEIGLRLLLSRIAVVIQPELEPKLQIVARLIKTALPLIDDATEKLKQENSLTDSVKLASHYELLRIDASSYASSYIVSFGG